VGFLADLNGFLRLSRAAPAQQRLVFYSRGKRDWPHLGPLLQACLDRESQGAWYVSSEADDPGLALEHPRLGAACVGAGTFLTVFLRSHRAPLLVTSCPDLGLGSFRRTGHLCEYVFVPHSLASTHMIYRERAFDEFDEVFCAGPHHEAELRRAESVRGLKSKRLLAFGSCAFDTLFAARPPTQAAAGEELRVLVAPSWGPDGLLERMGARAVAPLVDAGFEVVVRPHPETFKRRPEVVAALARQFAARRGFLLDADTGSQDSFWRADVMISDWSGAAMEFAFACARPVLFIDTPRKVNNPDYGALGIEPLEVAIRDRIGRVLPMERVAEAPSVLRELTVGGASVKEVIERERALRVFNIGSSAAAGARRLAELLSHV
jgi:hypothetical protein